MEKGFQLAFIDAQVILRLTTAAIVVDYILREGSSRDVRPNLLQT